MSPPLETSRGLCGPYKAFPTACSEPMRAMDSAQAGTVPSMVIVVSSGRPTASCCECGVLVPLW